MHCPHKIDSTCYAILPIVPTQEACRACTALGRGINDVSILENIAQLRASGEPVPQYLWDYLKRGNLDHGPGTTLKKLLSWFVTKPPNCACDDRAKLMNLWGKQKCREEFRTILGWLRESALDNGVHYNEFVVASIVRLAIEVSK